MSQSDILLATEYVLVKPATSFGDSLSKNTLEELRREVTLQAQGEAVELFDDMSPVVTVLTLAVIYDIASEAVLRLADNRLVLLFDHQPKQTLRPAEVNLSIWQEVLNAKKIVTLVQDVAGPKPEITLDLNAIWQQTEPNDDIIERTKVFVDSLSDILEPAITITIKGEIPALPLLLASYLARPSGHKLIFEDATFGNVTLF